MNRLDWLLTQDNPPYGKLDMSYNTWVPWFPVNTLRHEPGGWNRWELPDSNCILWDTRKPVHKINDVKCPTHHNCWMLCIDNTIPDG